MSTLLLLGRMKGAAGYRVPNPLALANAAGQEKNAAAYAALNVPSLAAGASYTDPVGGRRVWKVTSATVPRANSYAFHEYSDGQSITSREWMPGWSTIVVRTNLGYDSVDFRYGSGFTNWRQPPAGLNYTFAHSGNARHLYMLTATQLRRYNMDTMAWDESGVFPKSHGLTLGSANWFQSDAADRWFSWQDDGINTVYAYDSQTDTLISQVVSSLDEHYLDRDGGRIYLNRNSTPVQTPQVWTLATNTVNTKALPSEVGLSHPGIHKRYLTVSDVGNVTVPGSEPQWLLDMQGSGDTAYLTPTGGIAGQHRSGQWLGTSVSDTWMLLSTDTDNRGTSPATMIPLGMALLRLDGGQHRFVGHHYTVLPPTNGADSYFSEAHAHIAQSGKFVLFTSNMNDSPRTDVFLLELPEA